MVPVYLAIGSNIRPTFHIPQAIEYLRSRHVLDQISTIWETSPVGTNGPNFYNLACQIRSPLPPEVLRDRLREIEQNLGRIRSIDKFAPRPIDLDIVIYDGVVMEPNIWRYAYYAVPLAEILPDLREPGTQKRLAEIAQTFLSQEHLISHPEMAANLPS